MKTDRKTKAAKKPPQPKAVKGTRQTAVKTNGKHPLAAYEHIPIGIVEASPDGRYMDVNEEFCRILGYSRQELLKLGIKDCTHEDDYSIDSKLYEQLIAGQIPFYRLEKRFVRKGGGEIWVELTRSIVRDTHGVPLHTIGVVLDISERKDVERVLRDSAERLRLATGAAQMFMWEWDFQSESYILADNFEQVLGFSAGLLSKNSLDTIFALSPAEDVKRISEQYQKAIESHSDLHSLPFHVINPENGQIVWLEISAKIIYDLQGNPERMFGVAQNITEPKKIQDEIAIISRMPEENPNPVMRLTPDGSILYANSPSSVMLESWKQQNGRTIPEELQRRIEEAFASGTKQEVEITQHGKTFSCTLAPIRDAGYINFYGNDITGRKRAEEALRISEERMRLAIESNRMVAWEWDVLINRVTTSDNFSEIYGRTPLEETETGFPLIWPEDLPAHREKVDRVIQQGGEYNSEFRITRPVDKRVVWMEERATALTNASGQVTRLVGVVTDITERKQAEEKLRESEERFRALVSQATAGIAQSDIESRLTFVNPRFCDMLGYSEEELLGKTIWELTYTDDLEENKRLFQQMLAKGDPYQFEKRFIRKDGSTLWTNVSVTTVHDSSGKPKGGVGVMIDIEERRQAEQALTEFARQQEALYYLSEQLHRTDSLEDVYNVALDAILSALQCDRASILLYDHTDVMRFVAWRGLSDEYRRATDGHSPWKPDAKDPQPISMNDVLTADLDESLQAIVQGEGIGALAFIPLVVNEKLIGKFMIYYDEPHIFDEDELDLSLTIAHQLAFGIERNRTEQALKHERETLERLFETMPVMVSMINPATNSLRLNAEIERVLGWKNEEVTVLSLLEALYPEIEYRNEVLQRMAAAAGKNEWIEVRVQARDGHTLDSMWSNISIMDGEKLVTGIALGIDITERKQTEKRLVLLAEISDMLRNFEDPHELLYMISKAVGEQLGVKRVLFNEIDLERDLEIVHRDYHNGVESVAGTHKVSDYSSITSREVASGKTVVNVDSKTDPRTAQDYERTYALSGERSYVVVPLMRNNRWVASLWVSDDMPRNWSAEEVALLETIAERTWTVIEKLRINTELRESEERLRAMLETTVVGFATLATDTRFLDVNDAFCSIVGYSREELLNMDYTALTHPDFIESTNQHVTQLLAGEIPSFVLEKLYIRKDGMQIWVQNSVSVMRDSDGKPLSMIVICQDVTHRRHMEEQLRLREAELEEVINQTPFMLTRCTRDLRYRFVSRAYAEMIGRTPEEVEGKALLEIMGEEGLRTIAPYVEQVLAGERVEYESEISFHDVGAPFLHVVYMPDRDEQGNVVGWFASIVDISERKRAEERLRQSEERFRQAANASGAMVYEVDLISGATAVVYGMEHLMGYDPRETAASSEWWHSLIHPDDLPDHLAQLDELLQRGGTDVCEYRVQHKNGNWVVVQDNRLVVQNEAGEFLRLVGAVIDITERKRIEDALRIENERFMQFVNSNIVGILIGNARGDVILANDYYLHLLGVSREDLVNKNVDWKKFTPPEWRYADEKAIQELRERGVCEPYEKEYERLDGRRVPVYIADAMLPGPGDEIAAFVLDMTERKRAEEAVRASEERYRGIVNQTIGGIAETDLAGNFTMVNDRYCEITGYSRRKLLNEMRMQDLTHPDDQPRNLELFGRLTADGTSFEIEKRYIRPDGSVVWVHNSVSAIIGADGKPQSAVAAVIDVTERKRAEEALRRSEQMFSTLIDAAPFGVYFIDSDFRLRAINKGSKAVFSGIDPLIGRDFAEILRIVWQEPFATEAIERFRHTLRTGEPFISPPTVEPRANIDEIEAYDWQIHRLIMPDGTYGVVCYFYDLTEQKRMEATVRASETLYRAIARNIPGGGVYVVDKDFRYLVAEGPVTEAFGLRREILEGHTVSEVFPDERGKTMEERLRRNFAGETVSFETNHNGRVFWTQQAPLLDSIGQAIILTLDITERKQAEEALRESEERFARFMQHLPGLAWIKDMDGRYVYANAAAEKAFNVSQEELYGKMDKDIFPPTVVAQFRNNDMQVLTEEKGIQVVETLEHEDGILHYSLVSKFPIPGPDGKTSLIGGTAVDITERKQAEEALRESEERFRAILRQATAGIVRKDAEGRLIFVNQAFCNMLGYTEAELLGKKIWELMYEGDVTESRRLYDRMMNEGIPFKLERRLLRSDGSIIWMDASVSPIMDAAGNPQSAVAVEVDITGRKLAEEALQQLNLQLEDRVLSRTARLRAVNQTLRDEIIERRKVEEALRLSEAVAVENEKKLQTLFDLLPVGISFLAPDGHILQMNSALTNILKLSRQQVSSENYKSRKYIRPNGSLMPPTEFASSRALAENRTIYNVETGVVLEDGETIWTSVSAAPVAVADVGVVVVTVDITESKRAERALQESRERLRILSQRLVEVQEDERRAIARELHDRVGQTLAALNINLIIINSQLSPDNTERVGARMNDSMKLVAETISLVRDVMSDLRPAVLDDYGLEAALESHLSQYTARYDINTRFEKPSQPIPRLAPSIEMTFLRIAQEALMNIAKHAQATQVNLSLQREKNAICLTIEDNGSGIASWQEANRPGSHGLTIMRERAEAFGGSLKVVSSPGKGTTVEVSIPIEDAN